MKIDFQEKIDDYVLGKMSAEDRDKFEKEVSQDIEKQEQLKLTQNVSTAIKSRNEKLAMMQKWEQERIASKRKIMAWASSAIGVAAVFAIGFFLFVPKSDDVEFGIKEAQVYKKSGDYLIYNDETLRNYVKSEALTDESLLLLKENADMFLHYLQGLQDEKLSNSVKDHIYKEAFSFLIDNHIAKLLNKDETMAFVVSRNGSTKKISLSMYLQRLKNNTAALGEVEKIEFYEVDKSSLQMIDVGCYSFDICTHVLSLKENVGVIHSARETISIHSDAKEILKKNKMFFLKSIEIQMKD